MEIWVYLTQRNGMVLSMSKIVIDLERVLAEKGVSKTQLCYICRLQRTQLNNYCKNKVVRVDLNTIAETPHAFAHGRSFFEIASYGQTVLHFPQLIHFS